MFGFLRRKSPPEPTGVPETPALPAVAADAQPAAAAPEPAAGPRPQFVPDPAPKAVGDAAPEPALESVAEPVAEPVARGAPEPEPARATWLARLKQGLSKTRGNLAGLFTGAKIDEALFEELETALLMSDAGVDTTAHLLAQLRERVKRDRIENAEGVRTALRALLADLLRPLERPIDIDAAQPLVMMIAGVNGAGKTTSIGKLAHHLQREGKTVLLAAGDTFRAAAREQLVEWGARNGVQVISQQGGDPAAVAFDAVGAGRARGTGVVMIDTAGRLPTQLHLMDELKKIHRVIGKAMSGAPHEVLIVLDGNTGQNMLAQVRAFDDAIGVTGLIVTKLDGTAKGGTLAALAYTRRERPIPVCFIGVGEGIEDLQGFSADEFASALLD
jgi:fused signal recognition particle receptor